MATLEVARDFDQISSEYDATREPLDAASVGRLVDLLTAQEVRSVLEVGVGTGRIARPLTDAGLTVTGVDASRGMLHRARSKGLERLVRGNAYHLPFADRSSDGVLFVHVLHLLDDPRAALTEAVRVGRRGALALVHPAAPGEVERQNSSAWDARRVVFRILAEKGYPISRTGGGPPARERAVLAELPPDRLDTVSDREVTEPLSKTLRMFERRASRHTLTIPREVLSEAVREAEREVGDRTFTRRRIEALAAWSTVPG